MNVSSETMNEIIANVFDEMLAMTTEFFDAESEVFDTERVVASIRISGGVDGIVVVEAPSQTAQKIGQTMFEADADSLEEDEICDAVGEIVNMIGGNIKGMSEGDSLLSLPCVSRQTSVLKLDVPVSEQAEVLVSGCPLKVTWHHVATAIA